MKLAEELVAAVNSIKKKIYDLIQKRNESVIPIIQNKVNDLIYEKYGAEEEDILEARNSKD